MAIITSSWYIDLLTLFAGVLSILYFYLTSTYDYWKHRNVPFEKPSILLGNFYDAITFKKSITTYFYDNYKKTNEKFFGMYIFQRPYLLIRDPELIKCVLIKDFNNFVLRSGSDTKSDNIGRLNMFSIKNVSGWRFIRSKLSPFFSTGKMRNMFELLDDIGVQLTDHVQSHVNDHIDAKEAARLYTTDVIVSSAFGIQANSFSNEQAEFSVAGKKIFNFNIRRGLELLCIFFCPTLVRIFDFKFFSKEGSDFIRKVIWNTIKVREENNIKRPDLIEALITLKNKGTLEENGENDAKTNGKKLAEEKPPLKLDGDVLVAQAGVFFTAGFETTASTISFTLYQCALNPDIQIKLRKEIQSVIAANDGKFTYECLADMKYLDICIKETLRLFPTLGFLDREALNDYTFPGTNLTIEKGTPVIISLEGLHTDPQYFENPEVYDPERFNDENKSKILPCTYMPFGEGPRNCIGARFGLMSSKVGLVHILKDFEVETFKTKPPPLEIENKGFILTPKHGINLKFIPGTVYAK